MALFVIYLPSPFAEACLCILLVISPFLPWCMNWLKEWEEDCWSQSLILSYIFTITNWGWSSRRLCIFFFYVSHTFYFSFCWYTMSTSRWISYLQIQETKQRNATLLSCYSSYFPISSPPVPISLSPVQYQMEMMRSLRHVNIDHLHVGWYQSTLYGSFVSRALLDSQFSYQHAIEESVVLIYGKY